MAKMAKTIQTNQSITFIPQKNPDADKRKSSAMTQKIHDTFANVFNGIGCFEGTFSLQLKPDSKPYQVPPRHMAYAQRKTVQGGARATTRNGHHSTPGSR